MNKNKNNKGQAMVGTLIVAAIGVIVALVLLSGGISKGVGQLTSTSEVLNQSITMAAASGFTDIAGCQNYAGTPVVKNDTYGMVITTGNYTFTTRVSPTDSLKTLTVYTPAGSDYASKTLNATYTCIPDGYAEDGASRSMVTLVILLSALAILAFVLFYVAKNLQGII